MIVAEPSVWQNICKTSWCQALVVTEKGYCCPFSLLSVCTLERSLFSSPLILVHLVSPHRISLPSNTSFQKGALSQKKPERASCNNPQIWSLEVGNCYCKWVGYTYWAHVEVMLSETVLPGRLKCKLGTCKASWTRSITVRMGELVNCPPFSLASTLSLELGPQMAPTSRVQTHNRYGCYIYLPNIHPICTELSVLAIRLPFGGGAEEDVFPGEGLVLREVLPV